ncbi:AAA family ATPase [Photobacterium nomapromontoriensis]|uniref:AAA family ATPase n=1 Tax=Photobacterium nomapromontoriensis TaxID=2910237 RepID=UPI003D114687
MFDLAKAVSLEPTPSFPVNAGPNSCTLIYQSDEFRALIDELFLFEGWTDPTVIKESIYSNQIDHDDLNDIVLLELNRSTDVIEDARYFASQISPHKGVIVIGKDNEITTLRILKEMGFYYLYWPAEKQDLTDFILHVNKSLKELSGVYSSRKAKRVAVVGSKGGVGTTFLACELAFALADQGADTILVDHQYKGSNMDVMLGLKGFQRYNISEMSTPIVELDDESASLYLQPVKSRLRLLAMDSNDSDSQVLGVCQTLCQLLSRHTNFIIEDYSASIGFRLDPIQLVDCHDVVILVIEPSISSVRNAQYLIETLQNMVLAGSRKIRIIPILNHHRPSNTYELNIDEVTRNLEMPIVQSLPFNKHAAHWIIDGKRLYKFDKTINRALNELALLINGKSKRKAKTSHWFKRLMMR